MQYTSWAAIVFAALLLWAASDLDSMGPGDDRPGRLLMTIGFTGTAMSTAWWVFREATAPSSVRAAILAVDVVGFGTMVLAIWTYPATGTRWLLWAGAAVLVAAGVWLWRYRRRVGLKVATDEQGRVSLSDDVRHDEQSLRSRPW